MSNTKVCVGAKATMGLNGTCGVGAQLQVHLSYSFSAIWQLMTKVSLYYKQEEYRSHNPLPSGHNVDQQEEGAGPVPRDRLLQPWLSHTHCWVTSELSVTVITEVILAGCAQHRTAQEGCCHGELKRIHGKARQRACSKWEVNMALESQCLVGWAQVEGMQWWDEKVWCGDKGVKDFFWIELNSR